LPDEPEELVESVGRDSGTAREGGGEDGSLGSPKEDAGTISTGEIYVGPSSSLVGIQLCLDGPSSTLSPCVVTLPRVLVLPLCRFPLSITSTFPPKRSIAAESAVCCVCIDDIDLPCPGPRPYTGPAPARAFALASDPSERSRSTLGVSSVTKPRRCGGGLGSRNSGTATPAALPRLARRSSRLFEAKRAHQVSLRRIGCAGGWGFMSRMLDARGCARAGRDDGSPGVVAGEAPTGSAGEP
jgi:hypothetical protein